MITTRCQWACSQSANSATVRMDTRKNTSSASRISGSPCGVVSIFTVSMNGRNSASKLAAREDQGLDCPGLMLAIIRALLKSWIPDRVRDDSWGVRDDNLKSGTTIQVAGMTTVVLGTVFLETEFTARVNRQPHVASIALIEYSIEGIYFYDLGC